MITLRVSILWTLLLAPLAFSADISGFWKHSKSSARIEIQLEEGSGVVVRNDKFPDRVGRKILKDLQADPAKEGVWNGLIFVERLGEYKNATLSLPESDRMLIKGKVGFISRTVEWVRADRVPE